MIDENTFVVTMIISDAVCFLLIDSLLGETVYTVSLSIINVQVMVMTWRIDLLPGYIHFTRSSSVEVIVMGVHVLLNFPKVKTNESNIFPY